MDNKIIRPMLACSRNITIKDLQLLQYPLYTSVKQDGIRCRLNLHHALCEGTRDKIIVALSRSLKPIPNMYIQEWADSWGIEGLDGEIVLPGLPFHDIQSWVMTAYPMVKQPFEFRIFDLWQPNQPRKPFNERLKDFSVITPGINFPNMQVVTQTLIHTPLQLRKLFERTISEGEEGLILRSPSGLYKSGRSTFNEGYSLKMKAFDDDEATIIDCYPLWKNLNPKKVSELGLSKRSSHGENKEMMEKLGGFRVKSIKYGKFDVGSGFTDQQRINMWDARHTLLGKEITYKFQPHGTKDKPRTPIFKSLHENL